MTNWRRICLRHLATTSRRAWCSAALAVCGTRFSALCALFSKAPTSQSPLVMPAVSWKCGTVTLPSDSDLPLQHCRLALVY